LNSRKGSLTTSESETEYRGRLADERLCDEVNPSTPTNRKATRKGGFLFVTVRLLTLIYKLEIIGLFCLTYFKSYTILSK